VSSTEGEKNRGLILPKPVQEKGKKGGPEVSLRLNQGQWITDEPSGSVKKEHG